MEVLCPLDATRNQSPPHTASLKLCIHSQTLELGKFGTVNLDRGKTDQLLLLAILVLKGDKPMPREFDDLCFGSGEQQPLHHVGSHQGVNRRRIFRFSLSQQHIIGKRTVRILFRLAQFNCTGFVASLMVCRINWMLASRPVNSLN